MIVYKENASEAEWIMKLVDFGVASSKTRKGGKVVGTPVSFWYF